MADEAKQKPAKQFRRGAIGVSVWRREHNTPDGMKVFYNATPSRCFTKDDGKSFEYTDSFGTDDLPTVAALLNLAFMWICSKESPDAK
jgi:hypothetical protein